MGSYLLLFLIYIEIVLDKEETQHMNMCVYVILESNKYSYNNNNDSFLRPLKSSISLYHFIKNKDKEAVLTFNTIISIIKYKIEKIKNAMAPPMVTFLMEIF